MPSDNPRAEARRGRGVCATRRSLRLAGHLSVAGAIALSVVACRGTTQESLVTGYLFAWPGSHLAAWGPSVSPDHRWLAFVLKSPGDRSPYLGILDLSADTVSWVHTGLAVSHFLTWSPTGEELAFAGLGPRSRDGMRIAVLDTSSADVLTVTRPSKWPLAQL